MLRFWFSSIGTQTDEKAERLRIPTRVLKDLSTLFVTTRQTFHIETFKLLLMLASSPWLNSFLSSVPAPKFSELFQLLLHVMRIFTDGQNQTSRHLSAKQIFIKRCLLPFSNNLCWFSGCRNCWKKYCFFGKLLELAQISNNKPHKKSFLRWWFQLEVS